MVVQHSSLGSSGLRVGGFNFVLIRLDRSHILKTVETANKKGGSKHDHFLRSTRLHNIVPQKTSSPSLRMKPQDDHFLLPGVCQKPSPPFLPCLGRPIVATIAAAIAATPFPTPTPQPPPSNNKDDLSQVYHTCPSFHKIGSPAKRHQKQTRPPGEKLNLHIHTTPPCCHRPNAALL